MPKAAVRIPIPQPVFSYRRDETTQAPQPVSTVACVVHRISPRPRTRALHARVTRATPIGWAVWPPSALHAFSRALHAFSGALHLRCTHACRLKPRQNRTPVGPLAGSAFVVSVSFDEGGRYCFRNPVFCESSHIVSRCNEFAGTTPRAYILVRRNCDGFVARVVRSVLRRNRQVVGRSRRPATMLA
jgi:hypothetical protein